ncbi:hypothetical protein K437DRAFT_275613 [Tilletiaria anomala UBC 951]|uniref:Uncharacterized protein n=1 Tax=Tilletiaria anomala (strain ATCC 24038 / CBS 436.72 / UBC 951) TaxID=1037660 RepID=A0A066VQ34_TILAU|nr:uncharacterized protein K437DRAFT_275613 [Tilletiaria anomala UBC 951]KDN40884.1 hypothetical protein K437DRAFT_275613 [Tilletiaria anomala UBC 951]
MVGQASSSSAGEAAEPAGLYKPVSKLKSGFKAPSVINRSNYLASGGPSAAATPSLVVRLKRRKLDSGSTPTIPEDENCVALPQATGTPSRQPSYPSGSAVKHTESNGFDVYSCTWRKPQFRKHKTWDGDGYLLVFKESQRALLKCADSKVELASSDRFHRGPLVNDEEFSMGGKELQICERVTYAEFKAAMGKSTKDIAEGALDLHAPSTQSTASYLRETMTNFMAPAKVPTFYSKDPPKRAHDDLDGEPSHGKQLRSASPVKLAAGIANPGQGKVPHARFSTENQDAIIMRRPDEAHQKRFNAKGLPIVDVVIDPHVGKHLRPHQVKGVKFLYECVMGMREDGNDSQGAILADEMGLGKTLQTITLIHTLLKQSCYYQPKSWTIQKALIVCPLSLVKNWRREFRKWLGNSAINVLCIDGDKRVSIKSFLYSKSYHVMIIGYEKLRSCMDQLKDAQPPIDLIVCDEGHRLKSKDAKTTKMFQALSTPRRIILSGTPIQNDLSEFFNMVDFVAPGLLGTYATFKRVFEEPIMKSRVQNCGSKAMQEGRDRSEMLKKATDDIILRRTADLLSEYLKPKTEMVVFCAPSPVQLHIYGQIVGSQEVKASVGAGTFGNPLPLILTLRKLCNAPQLLIKAAGLARGTDEEVSPFIPEDALEALKQPGIRDANVSGKLTTLDRLLKAIHKTTDDKVVVVSNFTSTLDIIEFLCERRGWPLLRLDGKTKTETRQELVNEFNRSPASSSFVFLLSAKSGGVGLNLIGANRLVLFDSDWNPSTDKQAMARIHRDGQKKPCFIYRMLLAGTMDEKIYQRQLSKIGLSDSLMDAGTGSSSKASDTFSPEELRDIFTLHKDTPSLTHDLLQCECSGNGVINVPDVVDEDMDGEDEEENAQQGFVMVSQYETNELIKASKDKRARLSALFSWGHFDCKAADGLRDSMIQRLIERQNRKAGADGGSQPNLPANPAAAARPCMSLLEQLDAGEVLNATDQAAWRDHKPFDVTQMASGSILHVFEKTSSSMTGKTDADKEL